MGGTVYELDRLRCNLCLEVFNTPLPPGVGPEKYDAGTASMIALLKYGSGVPFYRLAGLQKSLGIPLPASTQWEIVENSGRAGQTRAGGAHPPGRSGGALLQRRYLDEDPGAPGQGAAGRGRHADRGQAHRDLHLGHRVAARGTHDRAVLHRQGARRREPGPGAGAARRRSAATHTDVRCPLAQHTAGLPDHPGALPRARTTQVCRGRSSIPGAVPLRSGNPGPGVPQRRLVQGAQPLGHAAADLPPDPQRCVDEHARRVDERSDSTIARWNPTPGWGRPSPI